MATRKERQEKTEFLNVDLELTSTVSLTPVLVAMGRKINVLHLGRAGRYHVAALELAASNGKSADAIMGKLVGLVTSLSGPALAALRNTTARVFNIGIAGGIGPPAHEIKLRPATVVSVAKIGGSIVITTYGTDQVAVEATPN